jgi:hypothetical protein
MNPASRAHRILRRLQSFQPAPAIDFSNINGPALGPDESWLGIYWNASEQIEGALLFSDHRVCIFRSEAWTGIDYSSIRDVLLSRHKQETEGLTVLYDWHDESHQIDLPVRGGDGKLRDAFEVLRFLNRVTEDLSARVR